MPIKGGKKKELLRRINSRARKRYDVNMSEAKFESLMGRAEIIPPRRWDWRAYRRALEVCRLMRQTPKGHRLLVREIRIQRFLNRATFREKTIRDDVTREFARLNRAQLRLVRNSLGFLGSRKIDPRRLPALRRQMTTGLLSFLPPRFDLKDLERPALLSITLAGDRKAIKVGDVSITPAAAIASAAERLGISQFLSNDLTGFVEFMLDVLAYAQQMPGEAAELNLDACHSATFHQYELARDLVYVLPWICRSISGIVSAKFPGNMLGPSTLTDAFAAIDVALKSPIARFEMFVIALTIIYRKPEAMHNLRLILRSIIPLLNKDRCK